eukprot:Blabericola_migrator_1__4442@NODE_237_length_10988_cov_176_358575_g201_i0_p4_GENE_NODE_237_length_10988_cov_176_358575_g201_i0NODE_237_length_10988_cov_176_358575_g201_i0_p4_ORF_typecomplete_len237_score53_84AhpCTSA/PF00578_21/5e29Redoxin/PF08534_10/6e181cysPrx_C/PF10417_9/1_2e14SCO1SenC/PF02630_14/0_031SCO1SenC/PF02630_14/7_6e03_NODE_237_length_10988_cov_176_358575_g201_i074784
MTQDPCCDCCAPGTCSTPCSCPPPSQGKHCGPRGGRRGPVCMIGKPAPCIKGQAVMPDGKIQDLSLDDYKGQYVVLFYYPLDFTFVCPSEILAFDRAVDEFKKRNVQLIGCSIDSPFTHHAWRETPINKGGIGQVSFPLLSDLSHDISKRYGCHIEEPAVAVRAVYLIDKEGIVRHITLNDLPLGRNVEEVLRVVDALQYTEAHGEVCPANWKKGDKAMKPSAEGVAEYLGEKYKA